MTAEVRKMNFAASNFIDVLESSSLFDIRENGKAHTPYETEKRFYSVIKNGDTEKAKETVLFLKSNKIVTGKMSDSSLTQMKYWAVCCVTLAARYAIEGGLDESFAFSYSDKSILKIDNMQTEAEIFEYILGGYIELCSLVRKNRDEKNYSKRVRLCIHYIGEHLHEKTSLEEISSRCLVSPDCLSRSFKKEVGCSIGEYIRKRKLLEAKELLLSGKSILETAYLLAFCSESHFIRRFREEFGETPKQFLLKG